MDTLELGVPHANIRDRFAALVALVEEGDVAAHFPERRVEARARGIDEHAVDGHLRAGHDQRRGGEERGGTRVAGNLHVLPGKLGIALDRNRAHALAFGRRQLGAEVGQHALGVVARGFRLDHRGLACRMQARDQDGRLDLGGRNWELIFDRDEIASAANGERQGVLALVHHLQPHP